MKMKNIGHEFRITINHDIKTGNIEEGALSKGDVLLIKNFAYRGDFLRKTHQIYTENKEVVSVPRMGKREKEEWSFFIDPTTGRRKNNETCRKCVHDCKQSYRAEIMSCKLYKSKRAVD